MSVQLILKHSNVEDKRPTANQLANGEIALNYNAAGPFLTCKDSDGAVQQIGGVKISEVAPDNPVKQTLWFKPSSLILFVYDGLSFLPVAGGSGGGGGGGGTGDITTVVGNDGIDASEIAGVVSLEVHLAGGDDGLEFDAGRLKASVATDSALGSVKIGEALEVAVGGVITPRIASKNDTGIVKIGEGISVQADGTISVFVPMVLNFVGSVDLTAEFAGQTQEPLKPGDTYINNAFAPVVAAGWIGIVGSQSTAGDLIVWDGVEWEIIATGGMLSMVDAGNGIDVNQVGGVATISARIGDGLVFNGGGEIEADVTSVNGQIGDVLITPAGIGALAPGDDISELNNDTGFITADDLPAPPNVPVTSVNNKTGDVVLDADDVGALQAGDNITDLTNDAGYITGADIPGSPVISVNGQTGVVVLDADDVGALESGDNITELNNNAGFITSSTAPVRSVNGKAGNVVLGAGDVGALAPGDNISELNNDAGFITSADIPGSPVLSVNSKTGNVVLNATDVGALKSGDNISELNNNSGYITSASLPTVGAGTITITQPGTTTQTFNVNQTGNTTIALKNDNTQVTPGNGALGIKTFGQGANATGTFTANQASGSTIVLPQIRYSDLSGKPTIPGGAGNGTITVTQPGTVPQTFTVNQSGDTTIALKNDNSVVTPGNGTITIVQPGVSNQSFTTNQGGNQTITLKNDNTQVTPGNGALTIRTAGQNANASGTFTANQSGASTITLPSIRYDDLSGVPNFSGLYLSKTDPDRAAGQIQFGGGYSVSVRNSGKMIVKGSGTIVTYDSDLDPIQHRFDMDEASRESTGYREPGETWLPSIILNTAPGANSCLQINRYYQNTGGSQAFAKALQINCRAANVNLSGGTTNNNNTPGAFAAGFAFTAQTRSSRFSFFNIANCLSKDPGTASAIDQIAAYYVNTSAFGYNDGTTDRSLQNAIIKGFDSNLTKDGSVAGATKVWSNWHIGDAPNYFTGFIRAAGGIDFSSGTTDLNANEEETIDRVERGTYTPELTGSATTVSYSVQDGSYQIIGNVCTLVVELTYTGASGGNQISITLPVVSKSYGTNLNATSGNIAFHNVPTEIASPPFTTTIGDGQTVALVIKGGARRQNYNSSRVTYDNIAEAQVRFSITYTI